MKKGATFFKRPLIIIAITEAHQGLAPISVIYLKWEAMALRVVGK